MDFAAFVFLNIGVFGVDADEVKSVSVMEGESVTLNTDLNKIDRDDLIKWQFVPLGTLIAKMHNFHKTVIKNCKRLELDSQTGSLTITNITVTDTGIYKLQIISNRGISYKKFNVSVVALHSPQCPSLSGTSVETQCLNNTQPAPDQNQILIVFSVIGVLGVLGVAILLLCQKGDNESQDETNNESTAQQTQRQD